jgi:hypothetical protein
LKDGRAAEGELIAVKTDSLLLFHHISRRDATVALADISVIRIVRQSKPLTGLLLGFTPGALGGAVWGAHASAGDMPELGAFLGGAIFGVVAGLVGLAAGFGVGADSMVPYAGLSEAGKSAFLAQLNRRAREPGAFAPRPAGAPAAGLTEPVPARRTWSRLRLFWTPGYTGGFKEGRFMDGTVPFRFTESLPPGEAGPYPSTFYWATQSRQTFSLGRVSFGYQWTRRLGAEIELSTFKYTIEHLADLRFTSSIDGLTYIGILGRTQVTGTTSLLIGLDYGLLPPATLQPHALEVGIAAGPAWVRTALSPDLAFLEDLETIDRRMVWTVRARISYDYHFGRNFSMGAYGEYRWLEADIPAFGIMEDLGFYEVNSSSGNSLWRLTEVTLPAQSLNMGGVACGLRFGFGF